jgi:integrase
MRGAIIRPTGRRRSWAVRIYITDPVTGARNRRWFSFPTRTEAQAQLADMLAKIHGGGTVPITKMTVATFLEQWLKDYAGSAVQPASLAAYRDIVRKHLIPALGRMPLIRLSALDIQAYYTSKLRGTAPSTVKQAHSLSPTTVHQHAVVLHGALQRGVEWGLLAANVCDRVKPPKKAQQELKGWDSEQTLLFLGEARRTSPHYPLFLMLAVTGCRPSEALGLRWPDVDLTMGTITIRQKFYRLAGNKRDGVPSQLIFGDPKSERGKRTIDIPQELVEALRTLQADYQRMRQEFGAQYHDLGARGPLVFCQPDGKPLHWANVRRRDFRRIVTRIKLPMIRPYDFGRHGHASWMYKHGVHPTVISQRLGHASAAFTMDTYGHLGRGMQAPMVTELQTWLANRKTAE